MAAQFQLFQPRKYADATDWNVDLRAKLASFGELEKAGAERTDELQYFMAEVVWCVIRGEITMARAVEFLSKTQIASRGQLQRIFADVLWLVGFGATDAPPDRTMREEFHGLCTLLEREAVLRWPTLALSLEFDNVPPSVCPGGLLRKKHNQAKTKARYTIMRFNLLREHSEGYAKLIMYLDRLASLGFEPEASPEEFMQAKDCLVEDVIRLAGFGNLSPNKILSMALDMYEKRLVDGEQNPLAQPLLALVHRLPRKRLTEVVVFQLLALSPPVTSGRDVRPSLPQPPPSRPSQFLAVATLIGAGHLDMDVIWSYLDPSDASLKQQYTALKSKYDDEVFALGKVDLGASSSTSKGRNSFGRAFQAFNQAGYQKFRLVAALISANSWCHAHRALLHLEQVCKPCLSHHVRSALCDLLKWLIGPLLRPMQKRLPHPSKPTLETSYGHARRFDLGVAGDGNGGPGGLYQATEFEQLVPQMCQVLAHLEYFLHTDLHLLVSLWRVVFLSLRQCDKVGSGGSGGGGSVVLDDQLVAVVYRHLLPAASLVPHHPQLSDLVWSVMSQLSVFQRYLIYSCWETMYESFLLKLVHEKTKAATKQILKRVVANAERRDLIAHESHFHVIKLCHSNPIPAIETMLRDVEIGFNVNMIQPYIECTNRCPEMTADVMGFVLTRSCAKQISPKRAFLNQADATLSPWLVNLGEFVGRFYKKHPQTDLRGLLSIITRRINSEATETGPPLTHSESKGESLIRVVLECLIEHMGGYLTVTDMNAEQLHCLAGGPRLKSESIAVGKKEDSSRKEERARQALFTALVDLDLVPVLWYSLSQQRHHFFSEDFSEAHGGAGGLKLLGLLFDGNHECLLKLIDFLAQACTRQKYMSLMPPLQEVFSMFEPALAFKAVRHGLAPYGRQLQIPPAAAQAKEAAPAAASVAPAAAEAAPEATPPMAMGTSPSPAAVPAAQPRAAAPAPAPSTPPASVTSISAAAAAAPAAGITTVPSPPQSSAPVAPTTSAPTAAALEAGVAITPSAVAAGLPGAPAGGAGGAISDGGTGGSAIPPDPADAEREERRTAAQLEEIVRAYLPNFEEQGLSMKFYITFWRLSLQDIYTPTASYDKAIAQVAASLRQLEVSKKGMERDRDHTHLRDYKALKKESARLQDSNGKLRDEKLAQAHNYQKVVARLRQERKQWFLSPSPQATATLVAEMICPRVLTSYDDALFCCHFVRLLIKLQTPGFNLLDFYNNWTAMITQCIRCCSEREAQILGVFLREMMSDILVLRRDEAAYQAEKGDNPCFHRNYYLENSCVEIEWTQFSDIRRGHSKWEGRIYKAVKQGLDSEDWMERRNALLLLSQCYEAFPWVEKFARLILHSVEAMRDKEEFSDVKTLASSLAVKLRGQRDRWVDKVPESTSSREHGRRGSEDGRRAKNPYATPQAITKHGSEGRSPRRGAADGKRAATAEQDGAPAERRSRHEGDGAHGSERHEAKADAAAAHGVDRSAKDARETKDHKESKEPKDGKSRERLEAKVSKESREVKEARAAEKESKRLAGDRVREKEPVDRQRSDKDREREKAADRVVKSTSEKDLPNDRKRSAGTSNSTAASAAAHVLGDRGGDRAATGTHADERQEKRRRAERDGDGGSHTAPPLGSSRNGGGSTSDRGASDRHGFSSSQHPRNALTSAAEPTSSSSAYYHSGPSSGGSSHDYRRIGYPSHTTAHSGGRYSDAHRRR